jgi:predicted kinase
VKKNLVVLRGLPCSGKTTFARELVDRFHYKRLSVDDLRKMLDNGYFSRANEDIVNTILTEALITLAHNKYDIVIDALNLNPHVINKYRTLAQKYNYEFTIQDFKTPLGVCIERDLERTEGRVGKEFILKIYNKYFINGEYPDV